jgi:uncharacterized protein (TIGR03435 family)
VSFRYNNGQRPAEFRVNTISHTFVLALLVSDMPVVSKARHNLRNALILAAVLVPFIQQAGVAQSSRAEFEVASVKPNKSGSQRSSTNTNNGLLRATNVTLRQLILQSFRMLDFQLGAPDWMSTERFDVEAKAESGAIPPAGTPAENAVRAEIQAKMLQSLLEDRFQLRSHRETKELPIFALVLAKDGPKLQPTVEGRPGPNGLTAGSSRTNGTSAGVEMSGSGITMDRLISMLASQAGRPIINKTDLTGTFDFTLKFAQAANTATAGGDSVVEPTGPSLFTAIQEQLGLKLESAKAPVEVLVIDSVQRPSEN